jgi:hypothetical protein
MNLDCMNHGESSVSILDPLALAAVDIGASVCIRFRDQGAASVGCTKSQLTVHSAGQDR